MAWLTLLLKLIPTIIQLMAFAEKAFDGVPDSGAQKKAMVVGTAKAVVEGIASVSTGGQKETWNEIAEPISTVIDGAASIMFPNDEVDV